MKTSIYLFLLLISDILSAQECFPNSNESIADACQITLINLVGTVDGTIFPKGDKDFFKFEIPRSGVITYTVNNVATEVAMFGVLIPDWDQTNENLAPASGNFGESIKASKLVCPKGKYYIKLRGSSGSESLKPYTLKITLDTSDIFECNDLPDVCTKVLLNKNIKGAINTKGDVDYYCFNIPKAGVVTYAVSFLPFGMFGSLYHESDLSKDLSPGYGNFGETLKSTKLVCDTGKYYLKLRGGNSGYESPDLYTLKITLDNSDVYECNDLPNNCAPILLNEDIKGSINTKGDVDYYCFNIPKAGVVTYAVSFLPFGMFGSLYHESDLSVDLAPGYGNFGESLIIPKLVCKTGKYYLKLRGGNSGYESPDLYTLKITLDTSDIYECNNDYQTATAISCNKPIYASINDASDLDFYRFTLTKSDDITILISEVPTNLDLDLELDGPNKMKFVPIVYGTKGGQDVQLISKNTPPGDYWIKLNDHSNNDFNTLQYKLTISCPSVVSTEEQQFLSGIKLFPNPANDKLRIEFQNNLNEDMDFEIRNVLGQIMISSQKLVQGKEIDVSILARGSYIITIHNNTEQISKQFIKL